MGSSGMSTSCEIKENRIPDEAMTILKSMATQWDDITDVNALQVIPLKGAMTNEVYQIKWLTNSTHELHPRSRKVLVRIYGEGVDIFFDRQNEIRTFEFISRKGQGPLLLGRFSTGRIEEFIRARSFVVGTWERRCLQEMYSSWIAGSQEPKKKSTCESAVMATQESCLCYQFIDQSLTLTASDLRDPEISALIAAKMKEFHSLDMPGSKSIVLWDRLLNWLKDAKRLSSPQEAEAFQLSVMEDEISVLEKSLTTAHQLVGFCHNDLQYGNIMMDEETKLITIIDYEYASYNPIAFDLANHFCEMAADYHTETPHIMDYSKYPGLKERQTFLHIYLSCSGSQPSNFEVEQLVEQVEKYTLASHLLWGLWGIISEHVNKIDFDYMEYARQRFQQYWRKKSEALKC